MNQEVQISFRLISEANTQKQAAIFNKICENYYELILIPLFNSPPQNTQSILCALKLNFEEGFYYPGTKLGMEKKKERVWRTRQEVRKACTV